jgi:hypothetical protein
MTRLARFAPQVAWVILSTEFSWWGFVVGLVYVAWWNAYTAPRGFVGVGP